MNLQGMPRIIIRWMSWMEATLMSKDLMVYIGEAITKWSKQYGMEQMPPNLVFKKALTLMNAWDRNSVFK